MLTLALFDSECEYLNKLIQAIGTLWWIQKSCIYHLDFLAIYSLASFSGLAAHPNFHELTSIFTWFLPNNHPYSIFCPKPSIKQSSIKCWCIHSTTQHSERGSTNCLMPMNKTTDHPDLVAQLVRGFYNSLRAWVVRNMTGSSPRAVLFITTTCMNALSGSL